MDFSFLLHGYIKLSSIFRPKRQHTAMFVKFMAIADNKHEISQYDQSITLYIIILYITGQYHS